MTTVVFNSPFSKDSTVLNCKEICILFTDQTFLYNFSLASIKVHKIFRVFFFFLIYILYFATEIFSKLPTLAKVMIHYQELPSIYLESRICHPAPEQWSILFSILLTAPAQTWGFLKPGWEWVPAEETPGWKRKDGAPEKEMWTTNQEDKERRKIIISYSSKCNKKNFSINMVSCL